MSLWVYRHAPSDGAVELTTSLQAAGVNAKRRFRRPPAPEAEAIVCWGHPVGDHRAPALNNVPIISKYAELGRLADAEVPAVRLCELPDCEEDHIDRSFHHVGGKDLLYGVGGRRFRVHKVEAVREFRIHVMNGVSIRAGMKVPHVDEPHPWVRSFEGGWKLDYGTACQEFVRQRHRDAAKAAVAALGLDFGAVDVGETADKQAVVFEVNRAPGLDGVTTEVYARKIKEWYASLNA
jgi:hypothetical protein